MKLHSKEKFVKNSVSDPYTPLHYEEYFRNFMILVLDQRSSLKVNSRLETYQKVLHFFSANFVPEIKVINLFLFPIIEVTFEQKQEISEEKFENYCFYNI